MAVCDKLDVLKYLIITHESKFGEKISRIKLQKALYFLYAFYGGTVRVLNLDNELRGDSLLDEDLFDVEFEAWAYGPVDRSVYFLFKNDQIKTCDFDALSYTNSLNDFTRGFLIDMTDRIFNTTDFSLVDLSHNDECWKNNFDRMRPQASAVISNESIKMEYATKS